MRSILRTLPLLLLAANGCERLTAIAQSSAPSLLANVSSGPHLIGRETHTIGSGTEIGRSKELDSPNKGADYPTITQLGLQYAAGVNQPDPSTAFNALQSLEGSASSSSSPRLPAAIPTEDTSYLAIDAPSAVAERESAEAVHEAAGVMIAPTPKQVQLQNEILRNTDCENGTLHGKPCRVSWWRVLSQSFFFLATQHAGNIAMDHDTRLELMGGIDGGAFWSKYVYCVEHYRWSRWKDDDPFGVDYIGHPMMGAVTNSIYEQNDPKQRALMYENSHRYWMGRLRATAYSAAYSAQWKVGPLSEASIGNTGINYYYRADIGRYTNETGMQDFFITPIGGLAWNVGEDAIDRFILSHVRHGTRNKWLLLASSLTTPGKSAANITRFRAPYYRDYDQQTADALVR
jgi:hypothetical protein